MQFKLATRKIQLIHGTAFVSLPQAWIKNYQVHKGDSVVLSLRDDGILEISPLSIIDTEVDNNE